MKASHSRSIRSRVAKIAWRPVLFVLLAVLCFPLLSHAQDTGYIGGTVIDKTGAAIAGAEITSADNKAGARIFRLTIVLGLSLGMPPLPAMSGPGMHAATACT